MSLFGTPPYPPLGDDASSNVHERMPIKSKKDLPHINSEISQSYDEDDRTDDWYVLGIDPNLKVLSPFTCYFLTLTLPTHSRSDSFGSFSVDYMKCVSSPGSCETMQSTSMPSAPPPPSPTFPEDENGSLCLSIGLDTLLTPNGDTLEDVKGEKFQENVSIYMCHQMPRSYKIVIPTDKE